MLADANEGKSEESDKRSRAFRLFTLAGGLDAPLNERAERLAEFGRTQRRRDQKRSRAPRSGQKRKRRRKNTRLYFLFVLLVSLFFLPAEQRIRGRCAGLDASRNKQAAPWIEKKQFLRGVEKRRPKKRDTGKVMTDAVVADLSSGRRRCQVFCSLSHFFARGSAACFFKKSSVLSLLFLSFLFSFRVQLE